MLFAHSPNYITAVVEQMWKIANKQHSLSFDLLLINVKFKHVGPFCYLKLYTHCTESLLLLLGNDKVYLLKNDAFTHPRISFSRNTFLSYTLLTIFIYY